MDISFSKRYAFIPFKFHFMFLCWFLGQVLPFLWRASGGSRNLAMLVGTLGQPTPLGTETTKKAKKRRPRRVPRPTTAITLTTTYWRRTECNALTIFLFGFFFWICKQWKPCWKRLFVIRTVSDFHSRTHQKEIKRLNLSMEGGINGSIDCFFSIDCVPCVPCVDVNSFQVAHPSLDLTLWLFWKIITVNSSVI